MKLYTEEQLLKALWEALWESEHFFSDSKNVDRIIKSLTPIELPSDEEIEQYATFVFPDAEKIGGETYAAYRDMKSGAKWMRDKLTKTKEK